MVTQAVESYLAQRRAAGFALRDREYFLKSFARFAEQRGDTHVRAATAVEWSAQGPSAGQRARRLRMIIGLARHLAAEDRRHEVPPDGVFGHHRERRLPFLFSAEDTRRLIAAAWALPLAHSARSWVYATLFALLAATGLRISEALGLRLRDLTEDGLVIRQTKFKKSRLVPLHPTAASALERYLAQRPGPAGPDGALFLGAANRPVRYKTVYETFRRLTREIGLDPGSGRRRPRIHDWRHTFAVRALEACPEGRDRVGRHLVALSTYLGHARVEDTYWYFTATPELMGDIARAAEASVSGGAR